MIKWEPVTFWARFEEEGYMQVSSDWYGDIGEWRWMVSDCHDMDQNPHQRKVNGLTSGTASAAMKDAEEAYRKLMAKPPTCEKCGQEV